MKLLKYTKIALLIVILAEEIRNARNHKKAIGKPFSISTTELAYRLLKSAEQHCR